MMGAAGTGDAGEDFMATAMGAGIIHILLNIVIAVFVCGDYSSGYAKNIFAVHSDPKDYIGGTDGEKITSHCPKWVINV